MITFDVAYTWLNKFASSDSQLGRSARPLEKSIEEALAEHDYAEIHALIDRLDRIGRISSNPGETAEICLACARAYYHMGEAGQALQHLDEAMQHYIADAHNLAIVQWLKGCLLWDLPGREAEAAELWERSLDAFSALAKRHIVLQQGAQWYQQRCQKMAESLQMITLGGQAANRMAQELFGIFEKLDPKYKDMPEPVTRVNANQFWIGSQLYQLIALAGQGLTNLREARKLCALKVEEDGMDLVGIEPGDYVLVRWKDQPSPEAIVAVFIDGKSDSLKFRRLAEEKGKFILRPFSRNPKQRAEEFKGLNKGFRIVGEVLGVFKAV